MSSILRMIFAAFDNLFATKREVVVAAAAAAAADDDY